MQSVVVLVGGASNEREVSLRSGAAVAEALRTQGYDVTTLDPQDGLGKLDKSHVAFPALHGAGGEDGVIQAALEKTGTPYVGSGVAASALCFDKWLYRRVVTAAGLPMADAELVTVDTIWQSPLAQKPFVLKPVQGGSTIDVFIVRDVKKLDKNPLEQMLRRYGAMLLETLILGTEITVAVLGDQVLPVIEIVPPENGEFDYDNKYNGKTREICPPESVSAEIQKQAQQLALEAHRLAGCRDLSRTDFMIDSAGKLYTLETNTLPGMTNQSLFPKAAAAAGIPFPELCDRLVKAAMSRTTTTV